jgi:hypothetical protein
VLTLGDRRLVCVLQAAYPAASLGHAGVRMARGPNCVPHTRMGRTGNACWSALCPSGEGLTGDVASPRPSSYLHELASCLVCSKSCTTRRAAASFAIRVVRRPVQDLAEADLRIRAGGVATRSCQSLTRSRHGVEGVIAVAMGRMVAATLLPRGDDQPIRFRAAEQQQVELP